MKKAYTLRDYYYNVRPIFIATWKDERKVQMAKKLYLETYDSNNGKVLVTDIRLIIAQIDDLYGEEKKVDY